MIVQRDPWKQIPALGHDAAMRLAATEYDRLLALIDGLREGDWLRPTDCPGWNVKALSGTCSACSNSCLIPRSACASTTAAAAIAAQPEVCASTR